MHITFRRIKNSTKASQSLDKKEWKSHLHEIYLKDVHKLDKTVTNIRNEENGTT